MMWYVLCGTHVLGFVIAAGEEEALKLAYEKYPSSIEEEPYAVKPRSRKRMGV